MDSLMGVDRPRTFASISRGGQLLRDVTPLLVFLILGASGAACDTGPFYAVANLYPSERPVVRLKKTWVLFQTDQISRTANYLAPIAFTEGNSQRKAQLGPPVRLEEDGWGVYSRIVPVRGSSRFIQAQEELKTRTTIFVIDPAQATKTTLASFPNDFNDADDGAYAVTRSGSHILLVTPKKITLRDIKLGRESDIEAAPLLELRRAMIQKRGNPGEWWLTDDLRYILVVPSQFIWTRDGESGSEPMPTKLSQLALDLNSDGIVYDRHTRRLSIVPVATDGPATGSIRIADVENIEGRLTFLYLGVNQPIGGVTIVIADASGKHQASHTLQSPGYTFTVRFAGWDPKQDIAWFQTRDARIDLPDEKPGADQHLIAWSAATNLEKQYDLTVAQIRASVEAAR